MQYTSYHNILEDEFERRKDVNVSYSLRAFARDLGIAPPRLSRILNRKEGLSIEVAKSIASKISLSKEKEKWFCNSVGSFHARSYKDRESFKEKAIQLKNEAKVFTEIHLEYFKVIADWYHFAILELTHLTGFKSEIPWIAEILGISQEETQNAIERMKSLDLLIVQDGHFTDAFKFLATPNDVPSTSLKKFNSQLMKKGLEALHQQDLLKREIASNIFAISKDSVPLFKEKLRDFRRELEHEASQAKNKDSVYCLSMQFFELTNGDKK